MWKIGQRLYYAQVSTPPAKPPVVRIIEGEYRGKAKAAESHRLKCTHARYPLRVPQDRIADTPEKARAILIVAIANAVNEHQVQIQQLYEALASYDRTARVVWPGEKFVRRKELPMPAKNATINTLATLQHQTAVQASRNSAQARLIAHHKARTGQHSSRPQQIASAEPRNETPDVTAEQLPLASKPEEAIPPMTPKREPPPINPTNSGPIPPTPTEANERGKPPRRFKPGQSA